MIVKITVDLDYNDIKEAVKEYLLKRGITANLITFTDDSDQDVYSLWCSCEGEVITKPEGPVHRGAGPCGIYPDDLPTKLKGGNCENAKKSGGCPLPNIHCGWPKCDE